MFRSGDRRADDKHDRFVDKIWHHPAQIKFCLDFL